MGYRLQVGQALSSEVLQDITEVVIHIAREPYIYKSHAFHVSAFMQSPCYPIYWCRTLHSMSSTGDGSLMTVKPQASFNNEMVHTVLLYTYNVGQGNSETLQEYCV